MRNSQLIAHLDTTETVTLDKMYAEMRTVWSEMEHTIAASLDEVKKYGERTAETEAKFAAMNEKLSDLDIKSQRAARLSSREAEHNEFSERKAAFLQVLRKQGITRVPKEMKSLIKMAEPDELKALGIGDDTAAGYMVPDDMQNEIIKDVVLISPIRQVARSMQTSRDAVTILKRTQTPAATWVGEVATRSETQNPKYGLIRIPAHEIYAEALVSNQLLEDEVFDLDSELRQDIAEQFAYSEGLAFLKGTGSEQPEGIMTNSSVSSVSNGDATTLKYTGILDLIHKLPSPFAANATLAMNRVTLGKIRSTVVDDQHRPIWEPTLVPGNPPTIAGIPYIEVPDMDDISSGTKPILIGDFKRGYRIVDRVSITVQILREKYAEQGQVAYLVRRRTGGKVVLANAFRKLNMA